jgi:hypothetical protein
MVNFRLIGHHKIISTVNNVFQTDAVKLSMQAGSIDLFKTLCVRLYS